MGGAAPKPAKTRLRVAVRAVLVHDGRLLIVNAYPGGVSDLWCAPGGGAEPHQSLPDNLAREVHEETGLAVRVGVPCLVNEFHEPARAFHQVEVFFRCALAGPAALDPTWADPEGVVTERRWVLPDELARLRVKPAALAQVAWSAGVAYDPLEPMTQ